MREIKFKAYFKNKVYDVIELDLEDKNVVLVSIEKDESVQKIGLYTSLDEVKIVQYTGLKDENGIEIYEGDVVRCEFEKENAIVYFEDGSFVVDFESANYAIERLLSEFYEDVQVIGNIYQNPELLTTKE